MCLRVCVYVYLRVCDMGESSVQLLMFGVGICLSTPVRVRVWRGAFICVT